MDKLASFRTSTAPIDIAINGNRIAIADLMKSVSVVEYREGVDGKAQSLEEVARHLSTTWGTAVAEVDDGTYLESDAEGNLLVLSRDYQGLTEADRKKLSITSHFRLGEMVNRIKCVDIRVLADAAVTPKAYMATVSSSLRGSLYLVVYVVSLLLLIQYVGGRVYLPLFPNSPFKARSADDAAKSTSRSSSCAW